MAVRAYRARGREASSARSRRKKICSASQKSARVPLSERQRLSPTVQPYVPPQPHELAGEPGRKGNNGVDPVFTPPCETNIDVARRMRYSSFRPPQRSKRRRDLHRSEAGTRRTHTENCREQTII